MAIYTASSQKPGVRPISFVLQDPIEGTKSIALIIRPEDLTRTEPSRMTVNQTLGNGPDVAWVDSFGPGLPQIQIAGTTGWRNIAGDGDGIQKFKELNKLVMVDWHARRKRCVDTGRDPDSVKLIFIDALDGFSHVVAPQSFTLRRSKSRPLLMQYNIALQTVNTSVDSIVSLLSAIEPDFLAELGLESLGDVISTITDAINEVTSFITGTIGGVVKSFLEMTHKVLNTVMKVVGTVKGAVDQVSGAFLGVARDVMMAGRNLFNALGAVMALPAYATQFGQYAKFRVMQLAGAYTNALCLFTNVFKMRRRFPDYGDWYGASNCSSTAGGSPLSPLRFINPFEAMVASSTTNAITVTTPASLSIKQANVTDMVLATPGLTDVKNMMADIATGVAVV